MSFPPQFHPPGAFHFDTSTTPGQPLHANVFRPPPSPTASSYNLAKSTGSLLSDISMSTAPHTGTAKRKRARTRESTPLDWHMNMEGAFDGREEEKGRESRYTMAGEISTTPAGPAIGAADGALDNSVYSDVDYRRALGPKAIPEAESPSTQIPLDRTSNTPSSAPWSLFSLQTIGDMVGKVWEFCTKGAFRGFQAGGGQGYTVNGATVTETTGHPWGPEPDTPIRPHEDTPMTQATPSYFPQPVQTPSSPVYDELSTSECTPQPAAKRRQVSANNDELRNWVVVDEPNNQPPKRFAAEVKAAAARTSGLARPRLSYGFQTSASTQRRTAAPSQRFTGGTPTLSRIATRPSLRVSHAGSPNPAPREPASFASPRSSPLSGSTPSRIPVAIPTQSPAQQSHNHNPFAVPSAPFPVSTPRTTASRPASRPASRHTTRQSLGSNSSNIFTTATATSHNLRPASPSKLSSPAHRRNRSSISTSAYTSPHPAATGLKPASRRQSLLPRQQQQQQQQPKLHHHQSQSQQQQHQQTTTTSPRLDAEARHLAQRKLAAERDADAKVDAFNARLLNMIRQGREALGTRVEVEMDEGDGDEEMELGMGMGMDEGVGFDAGAGGMGGGWEDDD